MAKPVRLNDATFPDWAERRVPFTLVLVRSAACAQSLELEPVLEEFGKTAGGKVRVATLDIDESPDTARKQKVEGVPTVLLLRDGRQVATLAGCRVSVSDMTSLVAKAERGASAD